MTKVFLVWKDLSMTTDLTPLQRAVRLRGHGGQRRLAKELGIHESTLSSVVNGRINPTEELQEQLSRALAIPRSDLFNAPATA